VIQRVKYSAGVVVAGAMGSPVSPSTCTKSRAWSSTITTITMPRSRSMPATRVDATVFAVHSFDDIAAA
jgi:hypothetical protein